MFLHRLATRGFALGALVALLTGCNAAPSSARSTSSSSAPSTAPTSDSVTSPTVASTTGVTASSSTTGTTGYPSTEPLVVADGNGWTSQGLEGQVPAPGSCHYGYFGTWVLPDPRCTPGSITPLVTSADLGTTICEQGYSASVRPPVSLTEPAKYALMRAYGLSGSPSQYEFDHLIPLELGGSSNLANLWPEPNQGSPSTFNSYSHYGLNAKGLVSHCTSWGGCDRRYTPCSDFHPAVG